MPFSVGAPDDRLPVVTLIPFAVKAVPAGSDRVGLTIFRPLYVPEFPPVFSVMFPDVIFKPVLVALAMFVSAGVAIDNPVTLWPVAVTLLFKLIVAAVTDPLNVRAVPF